MSPVAAESNELLVLTQDAGVERDVTLVVEGDARIDGRVTTCRTLKDLVRNLEGYPSPVVAMVDVDPQPMSFLQGLEPIVRRFPNTRFVVLVENYENEVVLEAMQIGVRHCMLKASVSDDLLTVLHRMLVDVGSAAPTEGSLVTVMTASGGCGGTTLAINLADEFRRASKQLVMLIDMDLDYGALASYLGMRADYGLADLMAHTGVLDSQLVSSTSAVYLDDLHILNSPASVDFSHPVEIEDFAQLEPLLEVCKQAYAHTVMDAPRQPRERSATLASASDLTLIVFELSVIDVRGARALMRSLTERGVPQEKILPVANRISARSKDKLLSLEDARDALGGVQVHAIANDYSSAIRSVNYGQPLERIAPRSPMRRDLAQLVEVVRVKRGGE